MRLIICAPGTQKEKGTVNARCLRLVNDATGAGYELRVSPGRLEQATSFNGLIESMFWHIVGDSSATYFNMAMMPVCAPYAATIRAVMSMNFLYIARMYCDFPCVNVLAQYSGLCDGVMHYPAFFSQTSMILVNVTATEKEKGEYSAPALWLVASVDQRYRNLSYPFLAFLCFKLRANSSTANRIGFSSRSAGGRLSGGAGLSVTDYSSDVSVLSLRRWRSLSSRNICSGRKLAGLRSGGSGGLVRCFLVISHPSGLALGCCYAAASSELNSMCIRSYGRMILSPSLSSTPPINNACTSLYTPRKSRLTIRDSSRMDIACAPSIDLIICQRLGASMVLASCSTVGNTNSEPMKSPFMALDALAAAARKALSTVMTLTVNTLMVLPPHLVNVCLKAGDQVFYRGESYGVFPFANMLMVSLTPLIVVAHDAGPFNNISKTVFVLMVTSLNRRFYLQNSDDCKGIVRNLDPCVHQLKSWHLLLPFSDVNNNITSVMMKVITSKKTGHFTDMCELKEKSNVQPLYAKNACAGSSECVNVVLHFDESGARFDSLNVAAGSRLISAKRYFCARNPSCDRIMAGRDRGAVRLAGFCDAGLSTLLRLATPFDSVVVRLLLFVTGATTMANTPSHPHPQYFRVSAPEVQHA